MADSLDDFHTFDFAHGGRTRRVHEQGSGPAVVVMAEMPGITPKVAHFARRVADLGCTVVMPDLFGKAGADPGAATMLRAIVPGCVSREFGAFAARRDTPVTGWLRALARDAHQRCGGPGVGAVGMCFTGGFALAMMADEHLIAPVLSQPSLPIVFPPWAKHKAADLGISDTTLATVKQRAAAGVDVLGLRFTCDPLSPGERFERLRQELGERFIGVEIDSSPGNPHDIPKLAHSVLTEHLVDRPGHPTHDALEQVLAFFRDRLVTAA